MWAPIARTAARTPWATTVAPPPPARLPWRSGSTWLLAGFLGVQSALAYGYLAWLAPDMQSRGWPAGRTGALLSLLQFAEWALVLPTLADLSRKRDRRPALVGSVACTVLAATVLFAAPTAAPWAVTTVLGLGLGGGFSLALVLLADLARDAQASSRLAAMTFLICYSVAAAAPVLIGALPDATHGYAPAFGVLVIVACVELAMATRLRPSLRETVRCAALT
ncbi:MAG: hypothetical protein JO168_16920 [Solirubrobacterales bacterium]|nr:hypothetical protein [Solirubrobacterales bacterium]MBV9715899.1 hypothetical protein [Solirubrobacterales bacterium]